MLFTIIAWVIGVFAYIVFGVATYGLVMRLRDEPWDTDDDFSVMIAGFAATMWPFALFIGVCAFVGFGALFVIFGLIALLRIDRFLRWVVTVANGR